MPLKAIHFLVFCISINFMASASLANDSHESGHESVEVTLPPAPEVPVYPEVKITDNPDEVRVPNEIWDFISTEPKSHYLFVPVAVVLIEKNPGVLKESPIRLVFPRGGGTIDLSQFVTKKQGSFFVKFEFELGAPKEAHKLLFISQTRKRKLDGEVFGAGCKKYMDVLDGIRRVSKKEGILVNNTRNRHLSVLGGTFIFAAVNNREVLLSQVTFKDSSHPEYFCDSLAKENINGPAESL